MTDRVNDWPFALSALVARRLQTPCEWGSHDCCLWAADAVLALTGVDYASAERGAYTDAATGMAVLTAAGGLLSVADRAGPRIGVAFAREGDIGLIAASADSPAVLAVRIGTAWLAPAANGLHGLAEASIAWGIGHA